MNDGTRRYLLEVESTTGFVAFRIADGTTVVSAASQASLPASASVAFWSCAGYHDTTPAGQIRVLDCHDNGLISLEVQSLSGLEYLDCSFNNLTKLPLGALERLQVLDADSNQLTALEVRCLPALQILNCTRNRLTSLDLRDKSALEVLDCSLNPLDVVNLDGCSSLRDCKRSRNEPAR